MSERVSSPNSLPTSVSEMAALLAPRESCRGVAVGFYRGAGLIVIRSTAAGYLHFSVRRVSMMCAIFQPPASFTNWNES